jgi:protein SPT2
MVKPSGHLSAKAGSRALSPHPNLNGSSNPKNQVSKLGSGLGCSVIQANGSLRHPGINGTKAVNPGSKGVMGGNLDVVKKKDPLKDHQRLSGSQPTNMQKVVPIKAPSQTFQVEQRKPPVMVKSSSKPVQKLDTKMPPKQAPKPLPKPQVKPAKAPLSRESTYDRPKKRKPLDDDYDDHEDGNVSSIIRRMFGYDPNKYRNMDDEDDRDMEVGFSSIQAEERRSERIAREEDERELALIEAEERAERERAIKKRKLQRK